MQDLHIMNDKEFNELLADIDVDSCAKARLRIECKLLAGPGQ